MPYFWNWTESWFIYTRGFVFYSNIRNEFKKKRQNLTTLGLLTSRLPLNLSEFDWKTQNTKFIMNCVCV